MKNLSEIINEKLIINKNSKVAPDIALVPKNRRELIDIIYNRILQHSKDKTYTVLDLNDIDVSNIDDFTRIFSYSSYELSKSSITAINVEYWDTSQVTTFSSMMAECATIKEINLDTWNVSNATHMKKMFFGCKKLETVGNISGWRTLSCGNMESMFEGCQRLKNIGKLDGWNVYKVENFASMFKDCKSLSNISFDTWTINAQQLNKDSVKMMLANTNQKRPQWILDAIRNKQ